MRGAALIGLIVAACSGNVIDVDLDLTDTANPCSQFQVRGVQTVKIVAYGQNEGDPCLLASECVTVGTHDTVEEIEAALRAKPQPLVSTGDGVAQIAVLGYNDPLCGDTMIRLCGYADAEDGSVAVPVRCENLLPVEQCSAMPVRVCP